MAEQQTATVYELRVYVTVPIVAGVTDYSPDEIVNRTDAALRHVPGDCVVEFVGTATVDEWHTPPSEAELEAWHFILERFQSAVKESGAAVREQMKRHRFRDWRSVA